MLAAIVRRPAIPAAAYLMPVVLTILPLWLVQFFQYTASGPRRHRPHPVVRPQSLLHRVFLRDRARWSVRRSDNSFTFSVLMWSTT